MEKKTFNFFELFKWCFAIFIVIILAALGVFCHEEGFFNPAILVAILVFLVLSLIFATILSVVGKKKYFDYYKERDDLQKELLNQRERADEIAKEKILMLKKLINLIDLCSVLVLISACVITFCFFALAGSKSSVVGVAFVLGVYVGLYFVRFGKIRINENKSKDYLKEDEYPIIYSDAYRAAKVLGCDGKIKIFVEHDFNASILMISDGYAIRLGSYLLKNMSEEELYNILLHEFAHVAKKNDEINEVVSYATLLQQDETFGIEIGPYSYLLARFIFEFITYEYVCSLINEDMADAAMREHGNIYAAASSLIKLKFSELYLWERFTYDEESIFEPEKMSEDCINKPLNDFRERMQLRSDDWIKMIDSEILSRNSTHPTAKMRIESLGVKELKILESNDTTEYLAEVDKAIAYTSKLIYNIMLPDYEVTRKKNYLEPKNIVDTWENDGKPITRENYHDIVNALFSLGRIDDFVKLCCQVLEEIPEPANYIAHHMYGIYLLKTYDEKGIDHLYKSIELNHNYWQEAMDTIGRYACIVGKQDQLDKYREKAPNLMRKELDVYEKMSGLCAKDKIVEEKLPDNMFEELIDYIRRIDENRIDKIYMVRKVIDKDNFVTCIIVQPKKKLSVEGFGEVMDKLFQYLDKSSDWEFSLFDIRFLVGVNLKKVKNSLIYDSKKNKTDS